MDETLASKLGITSRRQNNEIGSRNGRRKKMNSSDTVVITSPDHRCISYGERRLGAQM